MNRTKNTLFLLSSLDGKISTGFTDSRDVDYDYPKIKGIKEGLKQYYEIEKTTDRHSLNSGKVMAKIGMNKKFCKLNCPNVSFIIVDNSHLTLNGVKNLIKKTRELFLVTKNKNHPSFKLEGNKKLKIIYYSKKINFEDLFKKLKKDFKIKKITIQSGGTLNSIFLRKKLIDKISVVFCPCLIGGKKTPTMIDGKEIETLFELKLVKALKLKKIEKLKHSYLYLKYDIINDTKIEN